MAGEIRRRFSSCGAWWRRAAILSIAVVPLVLSSCFGSIAGPKNSSSGSSDLTGPSALLVQLFSAGETELNKKDYHGAIEDFATVAVLPGVTKRQEALAYYDVAVTYVTEEPPTTAVPERNADTLAAIDNLKKALVAYPDYAYALNDLAILESPTDPTYAITLYKHLLKLNPPNPVLVYTSLGNLLIQTGKTSEGQRDLSIADSINNPGTPSGPSSNSAT